MEIENGYLNALRRSAQAQTTLLVRAFEQKGRDKARRIQVSWKFITGRKRRRMELEEAELIAAIKFFHGLKNDRNE